MNALRWLASLFASLIDRWEDALDVFPFDVEGVYDDAYDTPIPYVPAEVA